MLRVSVFLALLAGASAAATGADSTCDTTLTLFYVSGGTACTASSGVCPSTCLAALEALDTDCAGKKYTLKETQNGKDVELALDWNTDKARYLILFQTSVNLGNSGSDDACNEVIHDYQLKHINDCKEARDNAAIDVFRGYYCKSPQSDANTCHVMLTDCIQRGYRLARRAKNASSSSSLCRFANGVIAVRISPSEIRQWCDRSENLTFRDSPMV